MSKGTSRLRYGAKDIYVPVNQTNKACSHHDARRRPLTRSVRLVQRARGHGLEVAGQLASVPVPGAAAEEGGENRLADVGVGAVDLVHAQPAPEHRANGRHRCYARTWPEPRLQRYGVFVCACVWVRAPTWPGTEVEGGIENSLVEGCDAKPTAPAREQNGREARD